MMCVCVCVYIYIDINIYIYIYIYIFQASSSPSAGAGSTQDTTPKPVMSRGGDAQPRPAEYKKSSCSSSHTACDC